LFPVASSSLDSALEVTSEGHSNWYHLKVVSYSPSTVTIADIFNRL